jgi:protein-tyrosine-phosphatase/predicted ATP-grasp superfamily ATP-dependent carboligase
VIPTVLVALANTRAALGAIRSLGRAGIRVTAAFSDKTTLSRSDSAQSRYIHQIVRCPDPGSHFRDFQAWLEERFQQQPAELFLPIIEAAVAAAAVVRRGVGKSDRFVMPDDKHLTFTLSKVAATQAAARLGLEVPRSAYLRGPGGASLSKDPGDLRFPLVVKWDNHVDETGAYRQGGNCVARDDETLQDILAELEPSQCAVMLQEFVPGHGAGGFYLLHEGKTLLRFAHQRLHEVPWSGGVSSLSESTNDPLVLEAGERLLCGLGYEGVAMVEFRQQPGRPPVFLEINGRLWGSIGLALKAGADFPRAMVEAHVAGRTSVAQPDLSRIVRCRNLPLEIDHIRSIFESHRNGDRHAPSRLGALASLVAYTIDPRTRSDLFWHDDPRPGLAAVRRELLNNAYRVKTWLATRGQDRHKRALSRRVLANSQKIARYAKHAKVAGIVFLCYGNICRSPYASARWEQMRTDAPWLPRASSAGFHQRPNRTTPARFQAAAAHRGIDLSLHRSTVVSADALEAAGLVVVMDMPNAVAVDRLLPQAIGKTVLLRAVEGGRECEIADPYGQPLPAGGIAYGQIDHALATLASQLNGSSSIASLAGDIS